MGKTHDLETHLKVRLSAVTQYCEVACDQITLEVAPSHLKQTCMILRDETPFEFDMLIDICGVDYLEYGMAEWATTSTTTTGFSRGVEQPEARERIIEWNKPRFAVVYHLLSIKRNQRLRLRSFPEGDVPIIDSVVDIWNAADWFERETFDLFGILFKGHPDLRRILTDYGFVGHPLRKDFPLIGHVEMRYDAKLNRVRYEPVSIEPRVSTPKLIRSCPAEVTEEGAENA